ncbi:MAG: hypothetical protein ACFCUO_08120 [Rhodospirillales bacterium]
MFGFVSDHRPGIARAPGTSGAGPGRRPAKKGPYADGGIEPALEDLLNDPVTEAMMRRDGVTAASLRVLIAATRKDLLSRELL